MKHHDKLSEAEETDGKAKSDASDMAQGGQAGRNKTEQTGQWIREHHAEHVVQLVSEV